MGLLLATGSLSRALLIHALAAPFFFMVISANYFRSERALPPLPAALVFVATVALLDLVIVAAIVQRSLAMFGSVAGIWLPLALILLATWATGRVVVYVGSRRVSPAGRVPSAR